jgi:hypothetical protein
MKFWTLIFTIIPIALLIIGVDVVGAQTDPPPRTLIDMGLGGSSADRPDIVAYLNSLFAVALGLAAIIAVIKIIIAGVKYMLSDVVTNKASAKDDIKNALLGLIILLTVYLILYTINPNLTRLDIFTRLQQLPAVSAPPNNNTQPVPAPGNTTTGSSNTGSGTGGGSGETGSGGNTTGGGGNTTPPPGGGALTAGSARCTDPSLYMRIQNFGTFYIQNTAICPGEPQRDDLIDSCEDAGGNVTGGTPQEVICRVDL